MGAWDNVVQPVGVGVVAVGGGTLALLGGAAVGSISVCRGAVGVIPLTIDWVVKPVGAGIDSACGWFDEKMISIKDGTCMSRPKGAAEPNFGVPLAALPPPAHSSVAIKQTEARIVEPSVVYRSPATARAGLSCPAGTTLFSSTSFGSATANFGSACSTANFGSAGPVSAVRYVAPVAAIDGGSSMASVIEGGGSGNMITVLPGGLDRMPTRRRTEEICRRKAQVPPIPYLQSQGQSPMREARTIAGDIATAEVRTIPSAFQGS